MIVVRCLRPSSLSRGMASWSGITSSTCTISNVNRSIVCLRLASLKTNSNATHFAYYTPTLAIYSSNQLFRKFFSTSPSSSSSSSSNHRKSNQSYGNTTNAILYSLSGLIFMIGMSYAAVPLYKMFCESQGLDVNTDLRNATVEELQKKLLSMKKVNEREIEVKFVAGTSADLLWKFEPSQDRVTVVPGETALAFFKAKNLTDRPIVGIATYTIMPFEAAIYFTKIQCFCFEEQRLEPKEEVDMPVFFYIDEEYANDPKLQHIDNICLSYTFFESKGSEDLKILEGNRTKYQKV